MSAFIRFAPSPTGYLHRGHVLSAIWVYLFAKSKNTPIILRIEDHDQSRCRPEYTQAIIDDLQTLEFTWDEISIQSNHWDRYQKVFDQLVQRNLVYPCECTRQELAPFNGKYPGTCRTKQNFTHSTSGYRILLPNTTVSWMDLKLGSFSETPQELWGDTLIKDRQGQWTYQFAVVVDDLIENIGTVVRGEDLLDSTARQILLSQMLGRSSPPQFLHHPLIIGENGQKLSKRQLATSIRQEILMGKSPQVIIGEVAALCGLIDKFEPLSLQDLFSIAKI